MERNDYFAALREGGTVSRTLEYRGREQKVHFRRLTAGERVQLLQGQTIPIGADGKARAPEIDLAYMTTRRQMLVQFSLVREDGSNVYSTLEEVQAEPEDLVNALHDLASTAFEEPDAGKS